MFGLKELKRTVRLAAPLITGARLKRVDQTSPCALVFTFDANVGKIPLLFTCRPGYARICVGRAPESAVSHAVSNSVSNGSFYQYLQAHLAGCRVTGFDVAENDRQAVLRLEYGPDKWKIIFSIMGTRSNIYILDSECRLVHAMRSLNETRNELSVGEPWTPPCGAIVPEGIDRWELVADSAYLNETAEEYLALERRNDAQELARRLGQALKKETAFLERKRAAMMKDLSKAQNAQVNRHFGELLKTVLHIVKPGDDTVRAVDYETGETVEIPIDAQLSPTANMENYFSLYHKEQRGECKISELLTNINSALRELEDIDLRVRVALFRDIPDMTELAEIAKLPTVRRNLKIPPAEQKTTMLRARPQIRATGKTGKNDIPSRLRPKRYRTEEGLEIWVGRNDEGNDYLTTRIARGNDLFFHLDGYPGSHVVLRTEGRTDPSSKSILDACELAVHFSKMKNAGTTDVHVAYVKDVKKPKGAKAGLVYVRGGRNIRLKRSHERLEKILSGRFYED